MLDSSHSSSWKRETEEKSFNGRTKSRNGADNIKMSLAQWWWKIDKMRIWNFLSWGFFIHSIALLRLFLAIFLFLCSQPAYLLKRGAWRKKNHEKGMKKKSWYINFSCVWFLFCRNFRDCLGMCVFHFVCWSFSLKIFTYCNFYWFCWLC